MMAEPARVVRMEIKWDSQSLEQDKALCAEIADAAMPWLDGFNPSIVAVPAGAEDRLDVKAMAEERYRADLRLQVARLQKGLISLLCQYLDTVPERLDPKDVMRLNRDASDALYSQEKSA